MSNPAPRPYSLLAEVTHRCPLHCPYCSNPRQLAPPSGELSASEWATVLEEAAALGALHVGFSGGEPLQRTDLEQLVKAAHDAGLYTNLITSAVGLEPRRAAALQSAGLDSVQISFQSDEPAMADRIAGASAHARKLGAARLVRELGLPLTINVVLHRDNIERTEQIIGLAEALGAGRLELANTQFYGWAFQNRAALLPRREQIEAAARVATAAKQRLLGRMEILFVTPDYYSERPKPCMNGWARRHITVNPIGVALPCPTAGEIKSLVFPNVREHSLAWIWQHSEAFNRFRGTEWMPEPCQSCEFRELDFGGCRCQAALLAGDAAVTDPACALSPHRHKLTELVEGLAGNGSAAEQITPRQNAFQAP
jgi:pyrroloquinoline quinone biosynthesis protein E